MLTRVGVKKHWKTFRAWVEGADVEIYMRQSDKWRSTASPEWREDNKYRVAGDKSVEEQRRQDAKYVAYQDELNQRLGRR